MALNPVKPTTLRPQVTPPSPPPPEPARVFETPEDTPTSGRWTCHPIQRFGVGRFQFENGLLELDNAVDVAEFEKVLSELPVTERMRIKGIDLDAAEKVAREYMARQSKATKTIDSSIGERAQESPKIGTGTLQDSNLPEGDGGAEQQSQ